LGAPVKAALAMLAVSGKYGAVVLHDNSGNRAGFFAYTTAVAITAYAVILVKNLYP
jgi:hypothetical protein